MTTQPVLEHAVPHARVVRVKQFLEQLNAPHVRAVWTPRIIAQRAGLPASTVYRAIQTGTCTLETLEAIARVFRGEVTVMLRIPKH